MTEIRFAVDAEPARVVNELAGLNRVVDGAEVELRLAQSSRERSGALVALAAWFAERVAAGRSTRVEAGPAAAVPAHMLKQLEEGANIGMSAVGSPAHEFLRIRDARTAHILADRVVMAIETRNPDFSSSVLRMARFVFEELGVNIVDHSQSTETGFGALTYDDKSKRLELAFADRGVGFYQSLQRNSELAGRVADDGDALQLAVTQGISGSGKARSNMGVGLHQLVQFSDLLGGELWIVSGSAALHRRSAANVRTNSIHTAGPWRGTWIALDAPVP
ncbi:MAG: hypothetical protein K8S98_15790 [Planctomycetes bacterium]|nr:hypothetical protein [Planctomycetota bacterium]